MKIAIFWILPFLRIHPLYNFRDFLENSLSNNGCFSEKFTIIIILMIFPRNWQFSPEYEKSDISRNSAYIWLVLYNLPCLRRTSGAMYSGVPQNVYRFSPGGVLLANPKSDNLGYPFASFHVQRHPTHGESAATGMLVTEPIYFGNNLSLTSIWGIGDLFFAIKKSPKLLQIDYINVGDGCWRRNILMTILRCWWRYWPFWSPTSFIF